MGTSGEPPEWFNFIFCWSVWARSCTDSDLSDTDNFVPFENTTLITVIITVAKRSVSNAEEFCFFGDRNSEKSLSWVSLRTNQFHVANIRQKQNEIWHRP